MQSAKFNKYVREPLHAGSWYTDNGVELKKFVESSISRGSKEIDESLSAQKSESYLKTGIDTEGLAKLKANIESKTARLLCLYGPHAGLSYSGWTNGHVYSLLHDALLKTPIKRIFLIGPSHHVSMAMEISGAYGYALPWATNGAECGVSVPCDSAVLEEIYTNCRTNNIRCGVMDKVTDEEEHSLEMHLPFLVGVLDSIKALKSFSNNELASSINLVPILIGGLSETDIKTLSERVLSRYFRSDENFFVFSTDFCHWGARFDYTYHYEEAKYPVIGHAIKAMDLEGVSHLKSTDYSLWKNYLNRTGNTICGRYPLSVMMRLIETFKKEKNIDIVPVHYSQSECVKSPRGSSVSYACGIAELISK